MNRKKLFLAGISDAPNVYGENVQSYKSQKKR